MSRVGDSQNPLLSGSDLSTIIERPTGPPGSADNGNIYLQSKSPSYLMCSVALDKRNLSLLQVIRSFPVEKRCQTVIVFSSMLFEKYHQCLIELTYLKILW